MKIVKFLPNNFTSPSRTPWGGHHIRDFFKKNLDTSNLENSVIGESWEFSLAEPLLSRCNDKDKTSFLSILQNEPQDWLSPEHIQLWGTASPLLIKVIDAAQDLSLQVHPNNHDKDLEPKESGKLEAWHILYAGENAGLYLGLRQGVGQTELLNAIQTHNNVSELFNFVPVKAGETYIIPPNTPHAIGANVMLLEPQFVEPQKSGTTFRLWDWDRTYDDLGRPAPHGKRRPIDPERACKYIDFKNTNKITSLPSKPRILNILETIQYSSIVSLPELKCEKISGSGSFSLQLPGELLSIFVAQGCVKFESPTQTLDFYTGEAGAIGASHQHINLHLNQSVAFMCYASPNNNA